MSERDWESVAAARLQRTIDALVSRIRATADAIEREGKRNIEAAAKRQTPYATYPRAAAAAIHELHTLLFNANASNIIDAATDAEEARQEKKQTVVPEGAAKSMALYTMLTTLDGWIEGARETHGAMEHRGENVGDECWKQFTPADIRSMINDAAREIGVSQFPLPVRPPENQ